MSASISQDDMTAMKEGLQAIQQILPLNNISGVCCLGSGWSKASKKLAIDQHIAFEDLPVLGRPGVDGHSGRITVWQINNTNWLAFEGRRHWYEGQGWNPIAFPVFAARKLNAATMLLTNAAGGLRKDFNRGDLMLINDHINAMGVNPLHGLHNPFWGERFPDQSMLYDLECRQTALNCAKELNQKIHEGIYIGVSGPTYETPAEVRAYRTLGADAIGMSTVPETILANACGLRVCAISCISNIAAGMNDQRISHEDVISLPEKTSAKMHRLLTALLPRLAAIKPNNGPSRN